MKASIDRDGCISCGLCETICSKVFRMAEDGLAEVFELLSEAEAFFLLCLKSDILFPLK